jgi:hypothetical protein
MKEYLFYIQTITAGIVIDVFLCKFHLEILKKWLVHKIIGIK